VFFSDLKKTDRHRRAAAPILALRCSNAPRIAGIWAHKRLAPGRLARALGKAVFLTSPSSLDIPFYLLYICSSYIEANCLGYLDLIE
jgi:hypothetical protein